MWLVDIARLTPRQMAAVVAIYREAFEAPWEMPAAELADFAMARAGACLLGRAIAAIEGEEAVGMALSTYLARSNLLHLKYLAVAPDRRGRGLGSLLLHDQSAAGEAIARAAGWPGCRGMLLEVEIPDGPPAGADRDLRRRRMAFYRRHGALHTGIPFPRLPSAPPEQPDWEVMLLPGSAWDGALDGPGRRALARALLVEGYGVDEQTDWLRAYLMNFAK
ncbi:MAG: GNAT family N-acetyltransferase [Anaerolineae bacterium]|nr:GNAT family N-acetyltransferase [Anaerolineae bacterium]